MINERLINVGAINTAGVIAEPLIQATLAEIVLDVFSSAVVGTATPTSDVNIQAVVATITLDGIQTTVGAFQGVVALPQELILDTFISTIVGTPEFIVIGKVAELTLATMTAKVTGHEPVVRHYGEAKWFDGVAYNLNAESGDNRIEEGTDNRIVENGLEGNFFILNTRADGHIGVDTNFGTYYKNKGKWRGVTPYAKVGEEWKPVSIYIKHNGLWRRVD